MGRIFSSFVKRPAQNWNLENRAQRFIEKQEKPLASPRHPSTTAALDRFAEEHPEIREELARKNEHLAGLLKGMVVNPDKMGEIVMKSESPSQRALPEDRSRPADLEFGYLEPSVIRPGRCSMRQALDFLADHMKDPSGAGSIDSVAKRYNLDAAHVKNILHYYHVFNMNVPKSAMQPNEPIALKPGNFRGYRNITKTKGDEPVASDPATSPPK